MQASQVLTAYNGPENMPEVVLPVLGCRRSHLTQVAMEVLAATAGLQRVGGGRGGFLQLSHGQMAAVTLALLVDGQLLLTGCRYFTGQAVKGILLTASNITLSKSEYPAVLHRGQTLSEIPLENPSRKLAK